MVILHDNDLLSVVRIEPVVPFVDVTEYPVGNVTAYCKDATPVSVPVPPEATVKVIVFPGLTALGPLTDKVGCAFKPRIKTHIINRDFIKILSIKVYHINIGMSTALLPINLTSLRTNISKLGTDRKDFKTLRSNKLAVIASIRESTKLIPLIINAFKNYKLTQITERSINIGGYEVVIKRMRDQRDTTPLGVKNEYKFSEYINQAINDNGYIVNISFKSSNNRWSIKNILNATNVGAEDIFSGKKADIILTTSEGYKIPISLKRDDAAFWGSPDTYLRPIAERFFKYIIDKKIVTLEHLSGNKDIFKITPRVAFKLPENIGKYMIFGTDILPNGAILIRSWRASDFVMDYNKENNLDITCSSIFQNYNQIDSRHMPYFVFNNDASRNVSSKIIPRGIRYSIMYGGKMGQAKIIDYKP